MECEAEIKALAQPSYKPDHTMVTNIDLIMARARLKSIIPHAVIDEWVLGHASGKKKHAPKTTTSLKRDSSECNSDVEHCIQLGGFPSTFTSYPDFQAILKQDGRFVATNFRESVEYAITSPAMIEYVKN